MAIASAQIQDSGLTLYAVFRSTAGSVWNGSAFESYSAGNWTNYDVAVTEQGAGYYYVTVPSGISSAIDNLQVTFYQGSSPAVTDQPLAFVSGQWDGSDWVDPGGVTSIDSSVITAIWQYTTRTLTDGSVRVATPHQVGRIEVVRGSSYQSGNSNAITITKGAEFTWPSDVYSLPWTVTLYLEATAQNSGATGLSKAGTVSSATVCYFNLLGTETDDLTVGPGTGAYRYTVIATTGTGGTARSWLLESGMVDVVDNIAV